MTFASYRGKEQQHVSPSGSPHRSSCFSRISILTAGFAFLLIPFTWHTWLLGVLSICMGIGLGCGQPLSMTTAYYASPKARTGEVLGLRLASNRLSQLLAPLAFGLVGQAAGLIFVFYISGAFLIGGAFLTRGKD
jgi:MFS family permease